jgi:DHA2 family multidrug resistance protein
MSGKSAGRLGSSFRPPAPDKPLGAAFREGPKAEMPSIVVVHPLALLRDVVVRRGWPKAEPDINHALAAAVEAGELDLGPVEKRYGAGAWERTPMVLFPPLLQDLQGYPESTIGYLVASRGLGNLLSFLIVAQLTRFDARLCLFIGLSVQAVAGWMMGALDMQITVESVILSNILHGFGFGLSYTPMAVLAFSTMPARYMTQSNAVFALIRMLGSSVFVSITLLVFAHSAAEANVNLASSITWFTRDLIAPWIQAFGHLGDTRVQAQLAQEIQRQASMIGYVNAFHLMTLVPIVTAPLAWLFVLRRSDG